MSDRTFLYIGLAFGVLIAAGISLLIHQNINRNKLDERQRSIRGSVALHTLLVTGGLLILGGVISGLYGTFNVQTQNFLILMLGTLYYIAESVVRGAYFGRNFTRRRLRAFQLLWLFYVLMIFRQFHWAYTGGRAICRAGQVTSTGLQLLIFVWGFLLYSIVLIGCYRDYRQIK